MPTGTIAHATGATNVADTQDIWLQGVQQTTNKIVILHSVYFTTSGGEWIANIKGATQFGETTSTDYTVYFYNT
jgi:hypothetical protein